LAKLTNQVADYTKELNKSLNKNKRLNVLPLFDKEIAKDNKLVRNKTKENNTTKG